MMAPLSSSSSLLMALSATVYFMVVLPTCSTQECAQAEELRNISAFLTKADIKLIQIKCMEDSCHQSNDISKKINKTHRSSVHQENHPKVQTERCGSVICNQTSKCVDNGHEKICVEVSASTTDASEDLTPSKTAAPALVTTHDSDPHATPSPARGRKLFSASGVGDLERVKQILAVGHVDINGRGLNSMTPVMVAARMGHRDVVKFLVGRGADMSLVDTYGENVLHLACWSGDLETVKLVLSLDVLDVNAKANSGQTAVDFARIWGHQQVLDLLVSRGGH